MTKVVIDTSIIIDFTRAGTGQLPDLIEAAKSDEIELFIPTVVILELWIGKSMQQSKNTVAAEKLFSRNKTDRSCRINSQIGRKIVEKNLLTGPMDAIIAASALELNAKLATGNRRHFEKSKTCGYFEIFRHRLFQPLFSFPTQTSPLKTAWRFSEFQRL